MTKKQSRRTQRSLEKALFERPAQSKALELPLEVQIENLERQLRSLGLSKRSKQSLRDDLDKLRARARVRDVLERERNSATPDGQ